MTKLIRDVLNEADDAKLCRDLFGRIVDHHGEGLDVSTVGEAERVVLLVEHVSGIVGNGGFRYLFEGDLPGDPDFTLTAAAFWAIGCARSEEAVRKTLAAFPDACPPRDISKRLRYYLKSIKAFPTDMDLQFFAADEERTWRLATYIRSHRDEFAHLDHPKPTRRPAPKSMPADTAPTDRSKARPTPGDLPRWARVAFAARCARRAFPLLAQHRSNLPAARSEAVLGAIDLAELSASEGRAVDGLDDAMTWAVVVAGAALATRADSAQGESRPENAHSGTIASFVAHAAEKAALAALAEDDGSRSAAMEAWSFSRKAAASADEAGLADDLEEDFARLHRVVKRGKWTDRITVPLEIWSML
jgi:hypothetical protein